MGFPSTVPTFENNNDSTQWVLYKGSTTSTPLGQVRSLTWTTTKERSEARRLSDAKKYRANTGIDVAGTLELWQDTDNAEVEMITGTGGMAVSDTGFTMIAEFWNGLATDSTVAATYTFTNWEAESEEGGPREAGSQTYWTFNFTAESCART